MRKVSWRERLVDQPWLTEINSWCFLTPDEVPADQRKIFLRNRSIVDSVLAGKPVKTVAAQYGVSPGRVSQIMNRIFGGYRAEEPALLSGILPNIDTRSRQREAAISQSGTGHGHACAFTQLLSQVPGLCKSLDNMLEASLKDREYAQNLTPARFHGEFKRFLHSIHWPTNAYPFTTSSCAYESVRRYYHQRLRLCKAQSSRSRKRSFPSQLTPPLSYPGRMIQIDEQLVDLQTSLYLDINGMRLPISVPRVAVLVAIDQDTGCILNYTLSISQQANHGDMIELLQGCITPKALPTLSTPALTYTPGANFPKNIPDCAGFQFGTVQLDNAWMHHANAVVDWIARKMGAAIHYGLPKHPTTRALVEHVFHKMNEDATHRPASTTGSHPKDPVRASATIAKKLPVVTLQNLNEMLAVTLSNYNVKPKAALAGMTPLRAFCDTLQSMACLRLPQTYQNDIASALQKKLVTVKHGDQRAPFINFCYGKYYGPCLYKSVIEGNKIMVRYDPEDIRVLKAYRITGQYLGELNVSTSWQRYPHSLSMRQQIHKQIRRHAFHSEDKLSGYFHYLLANKKKSESRLELARLHEKFTQHAFTPLHLPPPASVNPAHSATPETQKADTVQGRRNQGKNPFKWNINSAHQVDSEEASDADDTISE